MTFRYIWLWFLKCAHNNISAIVETVQKHHTTYPNVIPQDPLILPLVIVEPFGGAPADLVEGIGSIAEELNVRVQVNYC